MSEDKFWNDDNIVEYAAIFHKQMKAIGNGVGNMTTPRDFKASKQPKPVLFTTEKSIDDLKHELEVTEQLLEDRQRLLDAIPECPVHGKCVPYALEWIERAKSKL